MSANYHTCLLVLGLTLPLPVSASFFEWGLQESYNPVIAITVICASILFVVSSDYFLEITEHVLSENGRNSKKMLLLMYKELMLMGIISFLLIMIGSSIPAQTHGNLNPNPNPNPNPNS